MDDLLLAILNDPADDVRRLVYADWLDDAGRSLRAEFVRVQVELARNGCVDFWCERVAAGPVGGRCESAGRCDALRARQQSLLDAVWAGDAAYWPAARPVVDGDRLGAGPTVCFRRGLIDEVRLKASEWLLFGPTVARWHSVTCVTLTDCDPSRSRVGLGSGGGWWDWYPPRPHDMALPSPGVVPAMLPAPLWERLSWVDGTEAGTVVCKGYPSAEAALADLSRACLAYACEEVLTP